MDVFDLRLADKNDQPFKDGWLRNDYKELGGFGLPLVRAVTINEITTDENRIRMLREKYQPSLESMEGAALHFVCIQEGVRFIQLRSISNSVGERDKSKWEMKLAIKNLNQALLNLIELMVSTPSST
jgi:futalosine hydrolase